MFIKLLIIAMFIGIVYSLGSAMYYMVNDTGESSRTVHALTWRIGISVGLFIIIMLMSFFGIIKPHGVMPTIPQAQPTTTELPVKPVNTSKK